jgi:hypothetical protein
MKNLLNATSLLLAVSIPGSILAELLGARLPVPFDTEHAVGAFVIVITLLTAFTDYSGPTKPLSTRSPSSPAHLTQFPHHRAPERLAA